MNALLINPFDQTVSCVEYSGNYTDIYRHISREDYRVDTFTCVYVDDTGETLYVDDEGLYAAHQEFFIFNGTPLAGKALLMGTDEEGESVASQFSVETLLAQNTIQFVSQLEIKHRYG